MRLPYLTALFLLLFSSGIWISLPGEPPIRFEETVPADVLLVARTDDLSRDWAWMRSVQWPDVLGESLEDLSRTIPDAFWDRFPSLISDAREVTLVLHHLERRASGAYKPHLTFLFRDGPQTDRMVRRLLDELAGFFFGTTRVEADGSFLLIRGPERRQVLYLARFHGLILVSNSREGSLNTAETLEGKRPSLAGAREFRSIRERLPAENGVFLYCRPEKIVPLLPPFAVRVWDENGQIHSRFEVGGPGRVAESVTG